MERDTKQLDVEELHKAADPVRAVAIRRHEQGYGTYALNAIADAILRMMHAVATFPEVRR